MNQRVPACFFSSPPHIKCLSALIAGGKTDIKIGWLGSFSAPFVTLPLEPNCALTPCPPQCPPVKGQSTVHFPGICFSCQGSRPVWLMDDCPDARNSPWVGQERGLNCIFWIPWLPLVPKKSKDIHVLAFALHRIIKS